MLASVGLLAALLLWHVPDGAYAQTTPSPISGRVVQGTAGASLPPGLQVVLLTIDSVAGQIIERTSVAVDGEGRFSFAAPAAGPGLSYQLAANMPGNYAPSLNLTDVSDWSNIEVKVHESTTSLDVLKVTSYVVLVPVVAPNARSIGVLAVANLLNSSDRVLQVDLTKPDLTGLDLVRFTLPEGYMSLAVESDLPAGNTMEIPTGFALTNPVPPGEYNILMTYELLYEGGKVTLPLRLPFGADVVRVMLAEGKGTVRAEGLGGAESVILNDTEYTAVEGRNFARGASLDVTIEGLPQPTIWERGVQFFEGRMYILIIIWVAAAVMLGLLVYAFIAARRRPALALATANTGNADALLAARKISDADYAAKRETLSERALSLPSSQVSGADAATTR
jgi:hypothetical protein